ncbi:MAG: hypothetical protein LBR24_03270 [Methanobrevibacter sp.]|nr:hypothetical protein [Methanobrevibacter sp.]
MLAPLSAAHEDYSDENGTYHWVVDQEASNKTVHVDDSYEEPPLELCYSITDKIRLVDEKDTELGYKIKDIIYKCLDDMGVESEDNGYRVYQITQDGTDLEVYVCWVVFEDYYDHIMKFNPGLSKDRILEYGYYLDGQDKKIRPVWETPSNSNMMKTANKAVSNYFSNSGSDDEGNHLYKTYCQIDDSIDQWKKNLIPGYDDVVETPELGHWEFTPFSKDNGTVEDNNTDIDNNTNNTNNGTDVPQNNVNNSSNIHQNDTNKSYAAGVYKNKPINKSNDLNQSNNSNGNIGEMVKATLQHTGFDFKLVYLAIVLIIAGCGVVVLRRENN